MRIQIARSLARRLFATLVAAMVFVFLYEVTIRDSRYAALPETAADAAIVPEPGSQLTFTATAYCKGETTASGVTVRTGVAAADPAILPVGTVVRVDLPNSRYSGIWTVMDTGPAVRGRMIDLYLWSCTEALAFGRRPVRLTVLRLGWSPHMSVPGLIDRVLRQREGRPPAPVPGADGSPPK